MNNKRVTFYLNTDKKEEKEVYDYLQNLSFNVSVSNFCKTTIYNYISTIAKNKEEKETTIPKKEIKQDKNDYKSLIDFIDNKKEI